ncbi:hypothetical protein MGN70_007883 [Eutypa lata]|nr:hypothetical protein MGN70_007883 [Eutypa lata]
MRLAPVEAKESPHSTPREHDIVVEARSVATNPVDYAKEIYRPVIFLDIGVLSFVSGDVASNVIAIGPQVTRFKVGDPSDALIISASIAYEQACIAPLTFCTTTMGVFHKNLLALPLPSPELKTIAIIKDEPAARETPRGYPRRARLVYGWRNDAWPSALRRLSPY